MDEQVKLLLHPVRLRIVRAMRVAGELTTNALCARIPDVPKSTIYRHVERLLKGGVLRVEREHKIRGVVERVYRLDPAARPIGLSTAQSMTLEDHRFGFAAAVGALVGDFHAYLDSGDARPVEDRVAYRQFLVWLAEDERDRLILELSSLALASSSNEPREGRAPYVLSPLFFPVVGRPGRSPAT
jgi:DNA-binding transcriptional ArsR family regulator